MHLLKKTYLNLELYQAGKPGYPRFFTRDSIISAILMKESIMLKNQLIFCGMRQGKEKNPLTGEEPGKIFHEYPGFTSGELSTEYNACDTTALFLICHYYYYEWTQDKKFLEENIDTIKKAIEYICLHVREGIFYEDPLFSGAERFALKVTYWKDSEILCRKEGIPSYPVVYTLAHIQNMSGLRCAEKLIENDNLKIIIESMKLSLRQLYNSNNKSFYLAIDKEGKIDGITSDLLHSLFYLEKEDLNEEQIEGILFSSSSLETPLGYRTMSSVYTMIDQYHSETVWPFEQAIINLGAKKFGLKKVEEVSSRIIRYLDSDPEYFKLVSGEFKKAGCDPQLWTIAAKEYFELSN